VHCNTCGYVRICTGGRAVAKKVTLTHSCFALVRITLLTSLATYNSYWYLVLVERVRGSSAVNSSKNWPPRRMFELQYIRVPSAVKFSQTSGPTDYQAITVVQTEDGRPKKQCMVTLLLQSAVLIALVGVSFVLLLFGLWKQSGRSHEWGGPFGTQAQGGWWGHENLRLSCS
jgi:hypothetical protein